MWLAISLLLIGSFSGLLFAFIYFLYMHIMFFFIFLMTWRAIILIFWKYLDAQLYSQSFSGSTLFIHNIFNYSLFGKSLSSPLPSLHLFPSHVISFNSLLFLFHIHSSYFSPLSISYHLILSLFFTSHYSTIFCSSHSHPFLFSCLDFNSFPFYAILFYSIIFYSMHI